MDSVKQSSSDRDEDQFKDSSSRANPSLPPSNNYLNPFNMIHQFNPISQFSDQANPSRPSPKHNQDPTAGNTLMITKNPKKRTRASRRAPTTVLTTDTSNFREMVQEFTGIPAAPFSATGTPFSSGRFDIFRSSLSQGLTDHHINNSLYNISSLSMLNHHITVPMNFHLIPDLPLPRAPSNNNFVSASNPNSSSQSPLAHQYDVGRLPRDRQDERLRNHLSVFSSREEGTSFDSWICPAD